MNLPSEIQRIINSKSAIQNNTGLSGASVFMYDEMVLKVQNECEEADNEYAMLQWLQGKVPVPCVLAYSKTNKLSYLLMSKCSGYSGCSDELVRQPKQLAQMLSTALKTIWSVDIAACPTDQSLCKKLLQAEKNVVNGSVNVNNWELSTTQKFGFYNPETLLYWLQSNKPDEDLVLSHGDFCLPNVLFQNGKLSGIIDFGRAGIADKWCDIALCYRSLNNNCEGMYSGAKFTSYQKSDLFDALQIQPDWDKIYYYILLDELF